MSRASVPDPALIMLAQYAGILTRWKDAAGRLQHVSEPVLRHLLHALGLHCATPAQISDSLHQLEQDRAVAGGDLVVAQAGQTPRFRCVATGRWSLSLESGRVMTGTLKHDRSGWVSIPAVSELGYHALTLGHLSLWLAVVPARCPALAPVPAGTPRHWGALAQIYSLHERQDASEPGKAETPSAFPGWMHGRNFSTVGKLARHAARQGASALALSPSHAMFSADPQRYSPYSPSSRLYLNVAYADPAQVLGEDIVRHALNRWTLADLSGPDPEATRLDWPRITSLRLRLLRDVFTHFDHHGTDALKERFRAFRHEGGASLQHHAVYEALHAHHAPVLGPGHGWQDWSSPLRDPNSRATAAFAHSHEDDVSFHAFTQWLAHESLRHAQDSARLSGMACGLIRDLAIGTDPRGSHAWSLQDDILTRVSVGAPPDVYQAWGQNWGLTAFSPRGLRQGAYAAFIATLRANVRHAGGVRIDHVAGMERLWLIPEGAAASQGAYLVYPRHELLGLIALEATRSNAIVIGENLGTVSDELNTAITQQGMLGTSVLWFERDEAGHPVPNAPFRAPRHWPVASVAMPSTHDLPTINGWWQARDVHWRTLLNSLTSADQDEALSARAADRADLWQALQREGCVPQAHGAPPDEAPLTAILSFVARAPCPLALFSLEDLLAVLDQPNMPGATDVDLVRHPNWLQQLPQNVEAMFDDAAVINRIAAVRHARTSP